MRMRTFWKLSAIVALSMPLAACAADAGDDTAQTDEDLVGQAHAALSSKAAPRGTVPLYARATFDPVLGTTMVDVATTALSPIGVAPAPGSDPHTDDEFLTVLVYVNTFGGSRTISRVIGRNAIGPGGGCIHFNIVARPGDLLYIGGVVRMGDRTVAQIGFASDVEVVTGDWSSDPTVNMHPG